MTPKKNWSETPQITLWSQITELTFNNGGDGGDGGPAGSNFS